MEQTDGASAVAAGGKLDVAPEASPSASPVGKLSRAGTGTSDGGLRPEPREASKQSLGVTGVGGRASHVQSGSTNSARLTVPQELGEPTPPKEPGSGNNTPPVRRSVQFSRTQTEIEDTTLTAPPEEGDNHDGQTKDKWNTQSLLARLKALKTNPAGPLHIRTQSAVTAESWEHAHTADSEHGPQLPSILGTDDEADGEQSDAEEGPSDRLRRRRKSRRPEPDVTQTAPTTPKAPSHRERPHFFSSQSTTGNIHRLTRPSFLPRRNTMPEMQEEARAVGVSEDEGRQRLAGQSPWRRGLRNVRSGGVRRITQQSPGGDGSKPSTFRRALTSMQGAVDGDQSPSWRLRGDPNKGSQSAARLRQIIKMMSRKPKVPPGIDQTKSAELIAELAAGVPAALLVASMFQRDQNGHRRIPVLLEQLKVTIQDKGMDTQTDERHPQFRLQLEYGNGLSRMKWEVVRSVRDFWTLHSKYKASGVAQRYLQLRSDKPGSLRFPRFPRSVFPYLRSLRGFEMSESEEEREAVPPGGDPSRLMPRHRRHPSSTLLRRTTSNMDGNFASPIAGSTTGQHHSNPWPEKQRRKLEAYINQMIRYFMFRADSNRLCKFLELSAMGIRLASEGSYHGKEGPLLIQSSKGVDFRKALTPANIQQRHNFKWFLVRHSYIVCVESPEEMNIYDVFFIDSDFKILSRGKRPIRERKAKEIAKSAKESAAHPQHHKLKLINSERKLRLFAKTERLMYQFEESIEHVLKTSPWAQNNRFDSFAPVRDNVYAQFLVDGRDYMWNVSRAIEMAKDVIYIHDWWLSPELYMRRPAAISQKFRLDRLLQRKARQGVKVYVIMYRNINSAIPIDSGYTKFSLLELDGNIFVQRSPNQIRQNTFFWAHHEKICIVDHTIAFLGGLDLCFGRWDTPKHLVTDDKLTGFENTDMPLDADHCQLWPGKDYSNPRVQDFFNLDKPFEEMYDRSKVPRMPWHDVAMQIVGQPARDLTRHFVQRWNYILRQRKPSRPTPFLLPPPDFNDEDIEALGIKGTCKIQILRSSAMWSMGTPDRTERSIMNAYVKCIEESDHFVYIENQFFVSTSEWENCKIENKIGDALVERIIRAHYEDREWRAVILIPLMPGFQNTVDSQDGTSIRLIMQCQYRSICRGSSSIFSRLRAEGIDPADHIQFYGLRSWGKIGPTKALVTEQLYIHAKVMIVDDRVCIIGSANINERSMLGDRDSECAAIVQDGDMIDSTMNGEPYKVGKFAHGLRMRLMREHLGIDVDEIAAENYNHDGWDPEPGGLTPEGQTDDDDVDETRERRMLEHERMVMAQDYQSFNHEADWAQEDNPNLKTTKKKTTDPRVTGNEKWRKDVEGEGVDRWKLGPDEERGRSRDRDVPGSIAMSAASVPSMPSFQSKPANPEIEFSSDSVNDKSDDTVIPSANLRRTSSHQLGLPQTTTHSEHPRTDDSDIDGPGLQRRASSARSARAHNSHLADMKRPEVTKDCMKDPLHPDFYDNIWHAVADNNTALYRTVFRCMPDNEVKSWKEFKEFSAYYENFAKTQGSGEAKDYAQQGPNISGPPGAGHALHPTSSLGPIGEAMNDASQLAGDVGKRLSTRRSADPKDPEKAEDGEKQPYLNEKVQQWVNDADEPNAETLSPDPPPEDMMDERSAADSSPEHAPRSVPSNSDVTEKGLAPTNTKASNNLEAPSITYSFSTTNEKPGGLAPAGSQRRRKRAATKGSKREFSGTDDLLSTPEAEHLLNMVQGHLVVWPYEWLAKEEQGGNWLYSIDQLAPLEIYN